MKKVNKTTSNQPKTKIYLLNGIRIRWNRQKVWNKQWILNVKNTSHVNVVTRDILTSVHRVHTFQRTVYACAQTLARLFLLFFCFWRNQTEMNMKTFWYVANCCCCFCYCCQRISPMNSVSAKLSHKLFSYVQIQSDHRSSCTRHSMCTANLARPWTNDWYAFLKIFSLFHLYKYEQQDRIESSI